VRELGGLCVIGTERHEARRIDNQLRGRAGRQGDPGFSQFFLSLEDDLLRIFGGDRVKTMMERFDLPEDQPIQLGIVSKAVAQAQAKVEGANFDIRKHLLEYDDVLNKQRTAVYSRRKKILESMDPETLGGIIFDAAYKHLEVIRESGLATANGDPESGAGELMQKAIIEAAIAKDGDIVGQGFEGKELRLGSDLVFAEDYKELLTKKSVEVSMDPSIMPRLLSILDFLWMNHLDDLEALQESIGLRAYAQHDPLVAYKSEAHRLYEQLWSSFNEWVFSNAFRLANSGANNGAAAGTVFMSQPSSLAPAPGGDVGRNDPCPCGSGKKWKKCGLINSPEHQEKMRK
jgi:preprotein translocase subunit SecA